MKRAIIILLLAVVAFSCSKEKEEPIGKWSDIIQLSTKQVTFTSAADSTIVKTKGDWWWITSIKYQDSIYAYYNREDIDLESDSYKITENDFVVERRDKNSLFIKMTENDSQNNRSLIIYLEAGDYFDSLSVLQKTN